MINVHKLEFEKFKDDLSILSEELSSREFPKNCVTAYNPLTGEWAMTNQSDIKK